MKKINIYIEHNKPGFWGCNAHSNASQEENGEGYELHINDLVISLCEDCKNELIKILQRYN